MGQGLSCRTSQEQGLFSAVQLGDREIFEAILKRDSALIHHSTVYDRNSLLHIAAANGQIEVGFFVCLFFFFFFFLENVLFVGFFGLIEKLLGFKILGSSPVGFRFSHCFWTDL